MRRGLILGLAAGAAAASSDPPLSAFVPLRPLAFDKVEIGPPELLDRLAEAEAARALAEAQLSRLTEAADTLAKEVTGLARELARTEAAYAAASARAAALMTARDAALTAGAQDRLAARNATLALRAAEARATRLAAELGGLRSQLAALTEALSR